MKTEGAKAPSDPVQKKRGDGMDEKLIALHMKTLKCTREEAIQLIQDDIAVDKGLPLPWDLTAEEKQNARKARRADSKSQGTRKAPERKENPAKQAIITALENGLKSCELCVSVTVSNRERSIEIADPAGNTYTVSLTMHRAKK